MNLPSLRSNSAMPAFALAAAVAFALAGCKRDEPVTPATPPSATSNRHG